MSTGNDSGWPPTPRIRSALLIAFAAWPFTFAPLCAGQTTTPASNPGTLKTLSLEELSQIEVISPSKEPQPAFRVPMAIYVITHDEIQRSGATCIPEALRLAPGVDVARIDGNKWSVGIRGLGSRISRYILVLIDGRTVYTTLFAGTYWEVQDTMMEDIERIEVIRGPGGTIWGPNAVQGVINIITKPSTETHGTLASAGGGNEEQGFANVRYGGGNGTNFNYRFYAKGFTRGPEYHPDRDNFDDWRSVQAGFRMDFTQGTRDSYTIQGDIYKEEAGERVSATTYQPPALRIIDGNADLAGGNILARWKRDLGDGSDLQVQAYFDRTSRYEPNVADIRDTFDVDLLHRFRAGQRHSIIWGLGARLAPSNTPAVVSGLVFTPQKQTGQLYTAFLQDEIPLIGDRLTLTAGSKILRTNFTHLQFEPSVRLAWTPSDKQTWWASFTHSVRTPSEADEDFYLSGYLSTSGGVPLFARFNGNGHFAPEQLNAYELGYRRLMRHDFYIDFATFYNHYHNLFSEDVTGSVFFEESPAPPHYLLPAQFRNDLFGHTLGAEIAPEWRPTTFWRLRGSYSYLHLVLAKIPGTLEVGSVAMDQGGSPQHQGLVESALDLPKKLELDLTYRYVGELSYQKVPSYSSGDARLAWRFHPNFELALVGRNLLQPHHYEFLGDPGGLVGIRRSAYLKLTWMK